MSWSKVKRNLESFLCPALAGKVEYSASSYRYLPDRAGLCYITVDKQNILNMKDKTSTIKWYETELEIKNDATINIPVSDVEIAAINEEMKGKVPEERLQIIARNRKMTDYAKEIITAQASLSKSNFIVVANKFLSLSIEESMESDDILLNILALVDKRVGKKRILNMSEKIKLKHPAVQYFYMLRVSVM